HTRFDCDWSSDVCSSDLFVSPNVVETIISLAFFFFILVFPFGILALVSLRVRNKLALTSSAVLISMVQCSGFILKAAGHEGVLRSEERRVGKEGRKKRG